MLIPMSGKSYPLSSNWLTHSSGIISFLNSQTSTLELPEVICLLLSGIYLLLTKTSATTLALATISTCWSHGNSFLTQNTCQRPFTMCPSFTSFFYPLPTPALALSLQQYGNLREHAKLIPTSQPLPLVFSLLPLFLRYAHG